MFGGGPARRFVGEATNHGIDAVSALPGGTSADPSSPFYLNLLRPYLTNDYYVALLAAQVKQPDVASITHLIPASDGN
jgi:acyl-homoserine lactone acylase PvdQ